MRAGSARRGRWHDARAHDSQDLETWLERDSSPALWLAERIGARVPGLQSVEMLWADFVHSTNPEPSAGIVLKGWREEQLTAFKGWLEGGSDLLQVRADSPSALVGVGPT